MAGKTTQAKKIMDVWLMEHPGKKALVFDPKSDKHEIRYFVPNPQLKEGTKNSAR